MSTLPTDAPLLARPVDGLELSVRTASCLADANVRTVGELAQMTEARLMTLPGFGMKSLAEIRQVLQELGLGLAG